MCSFLKRITLFAVVLILVPASNLRAQRQGLPLDAELISLDSPQGSHWLAECGDQTDVMRLLMYFECQKNLAYCGPASAAMVLNSLELPRPTSADHGTFKIFTQDNFFCEGSAKVKPPEEVAKSGLSLKQLSSILAMHGAKAEPVYATDSSLEEFRSVVSEVFGDTQRFIIVNYLRRAIGQESGGHLSPIAAYHKESDRILVLDVSRYKYPPVWVKASDLWAAMTADDEGVSRGYVLVSKPN